MKLEPDPFEEGPTRARTLAILGACALACVLLTALTVSTVQPMAASAQPVPAAAAVAAQTSAPEQED